MAGQWKTIFAKAQNTVETKSGQLSNTDIKRECNMGRLIIEPNPIGSRNVNAASIDITPSYIIMSVKKGRLEKIYSEPALCPYGFPKSGHICKDCQHYKAPTYGSTKSCGKVNRYVMVRPRDTVLVLSREYIQVPDNICGNVYSRVSNVSAGLGHIATTIDPVWRGALLIAVSNPSSEWKRLSIYEETGNDIPLATVTFSYLHTPATVTDAQKSHLPARVDILERYMINAEDYKRRTAIFMRAFSKFFYIKRYRLTVSVVEQLQRLQNLPAAEWPERLSKIEEQISAHIVLMHPWRKALYHFGKSWFKYLVMLTLLAAAYWGYLAGVQGLADTELKIFIGSIILLMLELFIPKLIA